MRYRPMNRIRPTPWPWRQPDRGGFSPRRPAPPAATIGDGECVAYSISPKCGPMFGVALEVVAGWARVMLTWLPTGVQTIRSIPCSELRPWTDDDADYWANVAIQKNARTQ